MLIVVLPIDLEDWTILDIGSSLEERTPLEQQAYRAGLAHVPPAFLSGAPYGNYRSSGVLWVERELYHTLDQLIRNRLWSDAEYLQRLQREYANRARRLQATLESQTLELQQKQIALNSPWWSQLWHSLCDFMPYVAVNWFTEPKATTEDICERLGCDEQTASAWRLAVCVPDMTPHFIVFEQFVLKQVLAHHQGQQMDASSLARDYGCLQTGLLYGNTLEEPGQALLYLAEALERFPSRSAVQSALHELDEIRLSALDRRSRSIGEGALAAQERHGNPNAALHAARVLIFAANAEEERKVLQRRAMARLRECGEQHGLRSDSLSMEAFNFPQDRPVISAPVARAGAFVFQSSSKTRLSV